MGLKLVSVDDDPQVEGTPGAIGHLQLHRRQLFGSVGGQVGHELGLVSGIMRAGVADDGQRTRSTVFRARACVSYGGAGRPAKRTMMTLGIAR